MVKKKVKIRDIKAIYKMFGLEDETIKKFKQWEMIGKKKRVNPMMLMMMDSNMAKAYIIKQLLNDI